MAYFLRFDGTNDRVSIPAVPSMAGNWEVRFRGVARANADVQIAGSNANFNRQIVLRTALDVVRVRGSLNTAYDVPCVINQNEYIDLRIVSTVSPARLTVFKNSQPIGSAPVWVQQGQAAFTQGLDGFDTIGNVSTSFAQLDLYELQFKDATNDRRYITDGIAAGSVLPDLNNALNNGTLINFTGTPWIDDALFTLPATITPLSSFTSTAIAPFVDGAATISFGGVSVAVTIAGSQFTTAMPMWTDGGVYPKIPLASAAITLTQGANTSTVNRPIALPSGYQTIRLDDDPAKAQANFANIIDDDDEYIGWWFAQNSTPITAAKTAYWPNSSGLFINQDTSYELPLSSAPLTTQISIRDDTSGIFTVHNLDISEAGQIVIVTGQITSVGTVRIGGTTDVTVAGFPAAVNAGTLDGVALTSASDTSITVPSLTDGGSVPRPGIRELELTGGTGTGTTDVLVNPPLGWSSYIVTGGFTQAINGVSSGYLPAGWATGDFILSPNAPSSGKTTTVSDTGVVTNNVGNQELFLVDAATGLATAFDIETTSGAGSIGKGSASEPTMQVIKMETLKMGGLSNPGSAALLLDDTQLLDDTILED